DENILDLIEAAYFEGWRDGSQMGESDSPDWNAGEDWAYSDSRKRLRALEGVKNGT
ncbi:hypothetical protein LCGC14_1518250, partial [marine sediment metagenome]